MRLSEITFNTTGKSATTRYDFDEFINNAEFTGKVIGNYELWIGRYGTGEALLLKSDDEIDPGFLGAMYLLKSGDERYYHTEIMFDPEIQGKGLAVPMYLYVLQDMGLTIMSDRTQTPGGAAIWKKLAEMPGVNVYVYNTSDNSFHGEYDPKDSGRVYGPEDWRHKIRLVATTDTITTVDEAWSEKYKKSINCSNPKGFSQKAHCQGRKKKTNESVDIPDADDDFFKRNRFKRTEYGGMKLVYGYAYDLFQIYAYSAYDQAMGAVMFRYDSDCNCYQADDVFVETKFRRQGVATAMYDFAKTKLDAPIRPSTAQTKDGERFWQRKEVWEAEGNTQKDKIQQVVDAVNSTGLPFKEIWFHGSRARGDNKRNSDWDFLVLVEKGVIPYIDYVDAFTRLKPFPNADIQPVLDNTMIFRIAQEEGFKVADSDLNEGDVVQFNRQQRMYRKARALLYAMSKLGTYTKKGNDDKTITYSWLNSTLQDLLQDRFGAELSVADFVFYAKAHPKIDYEFDGQRHSLTFDRDMDMTDLVIQENFDDGKVKGKSRPGRVKRAGASCQGSVSHLRAMAKKYDGERGKMYHWCANMKSGKKKK